MPGCFCTGQCKLTGHCGNVLYGNPFTVFYYPTTERPLVHGWICPKCNKIHSPFVLTCDCAAQVTINVNMQIKGKDLVNSLKDAVKRKGLE